MVGCFLSACLFGKPRLHELSMGRQQLLDPRLVSPLRGLSIGRRPEKENKFSFYSAPTW